MISPKNTLFMLSDKLVKRLFYLLSVVAILSLSYYAKDANITEDARLHVEHGAEILKWFEGKESLATISPIDSTTGDWILSPSGHNANIAINVYGGIFDFLSAYIHQHLMPNESIYSFKHYFTALVGAFGFVFIGLLVFELSGSWIAAILGLLVSLAIPRLIGNLANNPKDIPLMTLSALVLLFMFRLFKKLPKINWFDTLGLTLSLAASMAIRMGSILYVFMFLFIGGCVLLYFVWKKQITTIKAVQKMSIFTLIAVAAYFLCSLLWPWAAQQPLINPLLSLKVFNNFNYLNSYQLFEGKHFMDTQKPWYFVLKWLFIGHPPVLYIGCIAGVLAIHKSIKAKDYFLLILLSGLLFTFFAPLLFIFIKKSNIYDGCRHLFFMLPPLMAFAAIGLYEFYLILAAQKKAFHFYLFFLLCIAEPFYFSVKNHPFQAMYFSPIVGSANGAYKNYEMDYWGYTTESAVRWLDDTLSRMNIDKKLTVALSYGDAIKIENFIKNESKNLTFIYAGQDNLDWDVYVYMLTQAKFDTSLYSRWPPHGTFYTNGIDTAAMTALILNPRLYSSAVFDVGNLNNRSVPNPLSTMPKDKDAALSLGLSLYEKGEYVACIKVLKYVLQLDPKNLSCINNLVAAYNNLELYSEAIALAKSGINIDPDFQLLKNNLNWAITQAAKEIHNEAYYTNLSYRYYEIADYRKSIQNAKEVLKKDPKSVVAFNNIGAAYNSMLIWDSAIVYCDKALIINPAFELAKNNKAWAVENRGK